MTRVGDQEWLERLWADHGDQVFAYAARRVGATDAEDVVADVFVVAWRHRTRPPRRELPWLYGVARKVLSDRYRSRQRQRSLLERVAALRTTSQDGVEPEVDWTDIDAALLQLSELDRETLLLTAWEGLAPADAAAALGVSGAAFRMRLSRARRRLRDLLTDTENVTPRYGEGHG